MLLMFIIPPPFPLDKYCLQSLVKQTWGKQLIIIQFIKFFRLCGALSIPTLFTSIANDDEASLNSSDSSNDFQIFSSLEYSKSIT